MPNLRDWVSYTGDKELFTVQLQISWLHVHRINTIVGIGIDSML
jgi:hypothetical protein